MCAPSPPKMPDMPEPTPPPPAPPAPPSPEAAAPLAAPVASSSSSKDSGKIRKRTSRRAALAQASGGLSALTNPLAIAGQGARTQGTGANVSKGTKKKGSLNIPK